MNTRWHSQTDAHGTRAPPRESGEKINYQSVGGRDAREGERGKWMFFSDTSRRLSWIACAITVKCQREAQRKVEAAILGMMKRCVSCMCVCVCVCTHISYTCLYVRAVSCLHIKGLMITGKYNLTLPSETKWLLLMSNNMTARVCVCVLVFPT